MKGASIIAEDYLKCIHEYMELRGYATLTDIANILGTARQTVFDEINILIDRNQVERIDKGRYRLTEIGTREAMKFLRKHRVAEILLWKGLGITWSELDDQAMGIEHGMTETIIQKVCHNYGCLKCPHGNYVPDEKGVAAEPEDFKITDFSQPRKVSLSRVVFESPEILRFLEDNSILPGREITILNSNSIYLSDSIEPLNVPDIFFGALRFSESDS
ncbi:MAG: metal-dependent transcriptional regulator [Thermoplasmataceae archaeon]